MSDMGFWQQVAAFLGHMFVWLTIVYATVTVARLAWKDGR